MPSIQLFLEAASKAETWPTTFSWESLNRLIAVILVIFQSALDYLLVGIHQFSEWAQKPGTLSVPASHALNIDSDNTLEIQVLFVTWFIVFWVVLFFPLCLSFGPAGVLAGTFISPCKKSRRF